MVVPPPDIAPAAKAVGNEANKLVERVMCWTIRPQM